MTAVLLLAGIGVASAVALLVPPAVLPSRRRTWPLAVPSAVVLLAAGDLPWAPMGVGVSATLGGLLLERRRRRRRAAQATALRVQGFCDELAGGLAAGLPVDVALSAAAGHWPELEGLVTTHRLGGSVPQALRRLAGRPGAADLSLVGAAWSVAHRSGASLASALHDVAAGIRDRARTRRVVASELASARATARLMAALPLFTLVIGSGAGGDPVEFLLHTTAGLCCLAGGLALGLVGLAWIESIAASVEATL